MLRWGIIGTGEVAYDVGYAIEYIKGNKIVAVSSRKEENAETFARTIGGAKVYADYHDLIKDRDIDIIYIATPNSLHYETMKLCFENGKHVLCEKPLTLNARQAEEIQRSAASAGKFCMEAMWTRFIPSIRKALELAKAGKIGEIKMIKGSFGARLVRGSRFDLNQGGGALLDLGVYLVSLTYLFLGMPDEIHGQMAIGKTGVDEQTSAALKYKNGALALLSCSFRTDMDNEIMIFGEKGSIKIGPPFYRTSRVHLSESPPVMTETNTTLTAKRNLYNYPFFMRFAPFIKENLAGLAGRSSKKLLIPFEGSGYHYQILEVNKCISKGNLESELMPISHSAAVLRIMDAVRKSCGLHYPNE